ncbi:cytoplasmic protein [Streptococcus suis]|nr:cytoplasmic protein [Streptococcus suis]
MLVKKIAFGNLEEAFIEEGLTDGVNIIFSDDNNKGKTLLFQAFMYSIGNTPIFPGNFKKEDYYFYSMINCAGVDYEFLRKKDTFLVIFLQEFHIFETLSELKYFLKQQKIFDIPVIEKNGREKVADLELFYELFFCWTG